MQGVGDWVNRWRHWENSGPRGHPAVGECDMPHIRRFEEVDYHLCVTEYIRSAAGSGRYTQLYLYHVKFNKPFYQHWYITANEIFTDLDNEMRLSFELGLEEVPICWKELEALQFPASLCQSYYVHLMPWWSIYEACTYVFVAGSMDLSYQSREVDEEKDLKNLIMAIYLSQLVVISHM